MPIKTFTLKYRFTANFSPENQKKYSEKEIRGKNMQFAVEPDSISRYYVRVSLLSLPQGYKQVSVAEKKANESSLHRVKTKVEE